MDVYEIITDRMIRKLEDGTAPWHRPWVEAPPRNLVSKHEYRGINVFVLAIAGFSSPWWLTFNQAKQLGGHVNRGEHATPVVFWKWLELEAEGGEDKKRGVPLLRYYQVFNLQQCEIPKDKLPEDERRTFEPIAQAQRVIDEMPHPPHINHGEAKAWYRPPTDQVNLPRPEAFETPAEYYSTAFHELTHSTGHPSRLGRFGTADRIAPFGSADYSNEELIAEMGAAFLCAQCGIQNTVDNSAAYIAGWLKRLQEDKRLVVYAAAKAHHAADFILGRKADGNE